MDAVARFGITQVREVMTPRPDIVAIPENATVGDLRQVMRETKYSRIPVYGENLDDIQGLVTVRDVVEYEGDAADPAKPLVRPAYFVPETKKIAELLKELQERRSTFAVVIDEYGGTAGLVTVEDIVEEIVGEIEDEHSRQSSPLTSLPDGSYLVAGRMPIDELNETLEWDLPRKDYDTVGGLILSLLGRIPRPGETVFLGRYELAVVDADERRILKVKVKARPPSQPPGPGSLNPSR
jgi:CBS domain containing-hemolysin-like protein